LYFTALQIGKVGPRIKIHHSDPSVERNTKIFQQIKQVFEPYHMVFQGVRGWEEQFPSQCFCKKKKHKKYYSIVVVGGEAGVHLFSDFCYPWSS
jgi:hypothetical protein